MSGVELDHAQDILADLIGTVVTSLAPGFSLAKLEGDAAFTYAPGEAVDGTSLLDTIETCYFGFLRRRRDIRQATSCDCKACSRIPDLDLKFVVHHGDAIYQDLAGQRELVGPDVIVVHRMLKNRVVEDLGVGAYAMITERCMDVTGLDPVVLGMIRHTESMDSIGEVTVWVHDLQSRWRQEEARARVYVSASESLLSLSVTTSAPPQVAWEFMTRPGQRMSWQPWVTQVDVRGGTGGRRTVGSENHCMHGPDAAIEEILDWRPYMYVTDRTRLATPAGPLALLHTIEFEPAGEGTNIHIRFAAPDTEAEREIAPLVASEYERMMAGAIPTLLSQLEEETASFLGERTPAQT